MRRVYLAFGARIISHQVTLYSALFVVSLLGFAKLVHVQSVLTNLLATELGSLPTFVMNAVWRGEVLTLLALGVMVFSALSIPWNLRRVFVSKFQVA